MKFENIFRESKIILTEGAIVERLKTEFNVKIDNHINHAGLIYTKPELLETLYRQYIEIAEKHNLPIMIMTPTRKVNYESIAKSKYRTKNIIKDSYSFLNRIKGSYSEYSRHIFAGGLLGCKGDAYSSKGCLGIDDSYKFHRNQTLIYQGENVDFLFAGIMPEILEAVGMAKAMAETGIPYIISFMIRNDGSLIDGTSICEAIRIIDNETEKQPICYMTNCIHPSNLRSALANEKNRDRPELKRFRGIQANASTLSPEELDNCGKLKQDDFNVMIDEMVYLKKHFDLKIFGGCCGTNDIFLDGLSSNLTTSSI